MQKGCIVILKKDAKLYIYVELIRNHFFHILNNYECACVRLQNIMSAKWKVDIMEEYEKPKPAQDKSKITMLFKKAKNPKKKKSSPKTSNDVSHSKRSASLSPRPRHVKSTSGPVSPYRFCGGNCVFLIFDSLITQILYKCRSTYM